MVNEPSTGPEFTAGGVQREILLMQALDARSMHQIWIDRGSAFLAGRPVDVPAEFAGRDDMCPIGVWLRERLDPAFRQLPLFGRTDSSHTAFHNALDRLFKQNPHRVDPGVRADFQRIGDELTALIEEWVSLAR
ncbi:MAG: hypothetical protein NVSMB31_02490 [Vulcanimicrobiaceae bacterium]